MQDLGQPKPRHQYQYIPRPYPNARGTLVYAGPLNQTAAVTQPMMGMAMGYGAGMGMGMGVGMAGGMGYGMANGMGYGAGACTPYGYRSGHGAYGAYSYGQQAAGYSGYANHLSPWQSQHSRTYPYSSHSSLPYSSSCVYPSAACVQASTTTTTTTSPPTKYVYITAATTPKALPRRYYEYATTTRPATREEIELENRRVATARGAYAPRRIKPADAEPDDPFWCRETNGEWHLRNFYVIENECQPGRWQMDAEHGFLVFHRE
jgi:hypothetical protein